jgi:putative copper resistance protein D
MLTDPLIAVRAIHVAATALAAGGVFFECLVAGPALRRTVESLSAVVILFRNCIAWILWISLALAVISGAIWLLLLAADIVDRPLIEVIPDGTAWIVLTQTRFGFDWQLRLLFAVLLGGYVQRFKRSGGRSFFWRVPAAALAAAFVGALAWAGHGGATPGNAGIVHLSADILHLVAAAAWLGGLVPFVIVLGYLRRSDQAEWTTIAGLISRRFSNLGIFAVGTLLVSGVTNASFLAGDMQGLTGTSYGRLLMLKILLFVGMVCLAAVNRQYLLPHLPAEIAGPDPDFNRRIARKLERNAVLEIAFGLAVVIVVAVLGVTPPAAEAHVHIH